MIDHNTPVTEDELHVYVDGELPADRREAVETWLSSHPDDAARVAAWRAQAEGIRARYGAVINEPVPDRLTLRRITRSRRSWGAIAAAATVAAFVIGGVAGWMARGASAAAPGEVEMFTSEALERAQALHRRGAPPDRGQGARRPICCRGCRGASAPRCARPISSAFDLKLLGGRLLPGISRTGGAVHV